MTHRRRMLGEITTREDLRLLLRSRADKIGLARELIDQIAGVPSGLAAKVLAEHGERGLTLFNGPMIAGALGCRLVLIEDPEARRMVERRWQPRNELLAKAAARARHSRKDDPWAALRRRVAGS